MTHRPAGPITVRQREVLEVVSLALRNLGHAPTVKEIGSALGLRSTATVHMHLCALERKGAIVREVGVPRGIRVVDGTE